MDAVKRQHLEELSQISSKGANTAQRTKLELSTQVHELEATLSRAKEVFANKVGSSTHDGAVGLVSNALVRRLQVARLKMENAHEVDSLANEVDRLAAARDREFVQMREEHETRVTKLEKSLKQEQRLHHAHRVHEQLLDLAERPRSVTLLRTCHGIEIQWPWRG